MLGVFLVVFFLINPPTTSMLKRSIFSCFLLLGYVTHIHLRHFYGIKLYHVEMPRFDCCEVVWGFGITVCHNTVMFYPS